MMMSYTTVSKTRYDIFVDEFKSSFVKKKKRNPELVIRFKPSGDAVINSDYQYYIDSMRQSLEDMEVGEESLTTTFFYGDASLGTCNGGTIKGGIRSEFKIF